MSRYLRARTLGTRGALAAALLLAAGLLAAGCGSSGSGSSSTAASTPYGGESTSASTTSSTSTAAASPTSSVAGTPAPTGGAAQVVKLAANPTGALSYNTTALTAHPGKVTIEFTNMAPLEHNVTVESSGGAKLGATPTFSGGTKSVTLDLKAGAYSFFCSVPGHRQAGMQGTLTVQ
jgi:plastocyanin